MDLEQLKLIIDMARDAGEAATWLVLLMIIQSYLKLLLYPVGWGILAYVVLKILRAITGGISGFNAIRTVTGLEMDRPSHRDRFISWLSENWKE